MLTNASDISNDYWKFMCLTAELQSPESIETRNTMEERSRIYRDADLNHSSLVKWFDLRTSLSATMLNRLKAVRYSKTCDNRE